MSSGTTWEKHRGFRRDRKWNRALRKQDGSSRRSGDKIQTQALLPLDTLFGDLVF